MSEEDTKVSPDGLVGHGGLPHQLNLRTGQLWSDGWSTLQLHQQRLAPELNGFGSDSTGQ